MFIMNNTIKPGTDNQPAGTYVEVNSNGKAVKNARTATIQKGDRLPPTQHSGNGWVKQK